MRRCGYCGRRRNCSALVAEESPFCSACLPERVERRIQENALFYHVDLEAILLILESARKKRCAYVGKRCDCKYGHVKDGHFVGSEASGCPELYAAQALLQALTPAELQRLRKRVERPVSSQRRAKPQ